MSGIKTTKTQPSKTKTVKPVLGREEPPVRWPSAATSGSGAYVSHPAPTSEECPETGAKG